MKLERVVLTGFLSHRSTDWSPNGARLVSLVGANGAGKSTLASDALMYALWDEARGRSDDVVTLGQTDAAVVVEFSFAGARYRVTRGRTTKSGGRSYLELAIADGEAWRPLTRETIRETEQAIAELLRLDAATFETAVLLGQGKANRFAEATAGERKRILGTVLGLDVYALAEARARELARDVDATVGERRSHLEQLLPQLDRRDELEGQRAAAIGRLEGAVHGRAEATEERTSIEATIHTLDLALAAADALAGQITALERDRTQAGEDWRRAQATIAASGESIAAANRSLEAAGDVDAAAAALPGMKVELEALVAAEAADRGIRQDLERRRAAVRGMESAYSDAVSTHRATYEAARRRVDELAAAAQGLEPVICEKCQHPNVVDQAGILPSLSTARAEFKALEKAGPPKAPAGLLTEQAAIDGAERRRVEAGFDPTRLAELHAEVTRLSSTAARSEALEAARATVKREETAIAEAEASKVRITAKGQELAGRIAALQAKLAEAEPFRAERVAHAAKVDRIRMDISALEGVQREAEREVATAAALLEQLTVVEADVARIRATIEAADVELGRLRRLVTAFGVTGIPARIIEGVLPELASYANELLGELRPGMTLELRAQRAKKSGAGVVEALDLVVRDAAGERPLALFSGGERMSVSLALAVGLSRLVARRAGSRIESLVIDEPDGLDAAARRAFGQALRVIAHRGDLARVVLVSHHDDLAEFGDATYQVTKGPQGSVVELVA